MFSAKDTLAKVDPELWKAMQAEVQRQEDHIELIASENYVSEAVMEAQGSQLTNKYAEGYPGKRYYGGCEHVDVVEQLAIDRLKKLFGADCANVQKSWSAPIAHSSRATWNFSSSPTSHRTIYRSRCARSRLSATACAIRVPAL